MTLISMGNRLKHAPTQEVLEGFYLPQKKISSKYLYDKKGSELFEEICKLDEYYLTRTEIKILKAHVHEVAALMEDDSTLIEFGSGSSLKTRILLNSLKTQITYVPVDISKKFLLETAELLKKEFTQFEIRPICADFTNPLSIAKELTDQNGKRLVFFPGSTLGNFDPKSAQKLLSRTAQLIGKDGYLLIGIDLVKEKSILEAAYNDKKGITAAFNLNLLNHLNQNYNADFKLDHFQHRAFFNSEERRIEMHLISLKEQWVQIDGSLVQFKQNESLHTEDSYKYDFVNFETLVNQAGFNVHHRWTDPAELFAVYLLKVDRTLSMLTRD